MKPKKEHKARLPVELDELIIKKNHRMQDLEYTRVHKTDSEVQVLAAELADMELKIGSELLKVDNHEEAAVNFVSAAQCLILAHKPAAAAKAFAKAAKATRMPDFRKWILDTKRTYAESKKK